MKIRPVRADLKNCLRTRNLIKKWEKVRFFFEENIRHPSLETELLEPHWRGIYSFRIDKKYRALFFISTPSQNTPRLAAGMNGRYSNPSRGV